MKNQYSKYSQPLSLLFFSIAIAGASANVHAHNSFCENIDSIIATNLDTMQAHSFRSGNYNANKLEQSRIMLDSVFAKSLVKDDSFTCDFKKSQQKGLMVLTSTNNKVRSYAWNIGTGGTMHNYAGFYQFKDNKNKLHIQDMTVNGDKNNSEHSLHSFPNALFTTTLNGETTYMIIFTGIFSTKDNSQSLQAFTINNDKMLSAKVIRTKSGLTNKLSFSYDFFSVVDRPERPIQLFEYDTNSKTIRFPVVVADNEYPSGKVTNKNIAYTFDGQYFQRAKN